MSFDFELPGIFAGFTVTKSKRFIIAGYASVDLIDREGERIPLPALKEAFEEMMKIPERRNLMLHHSNIQIGRILPEYVDEKGRVWRSGVDDIGLFIVAELFPDRTEARRVMHEMLNGHYLSFSIGGRALRSKTKCSTELCWNEISKLELYEVTICEAGVNPGAKAFVLEPGAFTDVSKMSDECRETFIKELSLGQPGEAMSEEIVEQPEAEMEKSELERLMEMVQKNAEAIAELRGIIESMQKSEEAEEGQKPCEETEKQEVEEPSEAEEKAEDDIKAVLDELKVAIAELKAAIAELKAGYKYPYPKYPYYKPPVKEDFESEEEFEEAKKAFDEFVAKLRKEIEEEVKKEMGEVVAKSEIPPPEPSEEKINIEEIFKKAEEIDDLELLLHQEGIEI